MVDETLLAEIFGAFGQLQSCKIVRDSAGVGGFCDYADYNSARCLSCLLRVGKAMCARCTHGCMCFFCYHPGRTAAPSAMTRVEL